MLKKKDMILLAIVLLLAGVMALFMYMDHGKSGETIRIIIDGKEYGSYPMNVDRSIEVENEFCYNRIVIENREISMQEADCPDQYCVEHIAISKTNETIVCLPHRLVVEVLAPMGEDGIDGVAQ